ncbi:hypothetical protein DFH06DRAFT_684337 [Mycena polygramma]|nr:hypothetical protein DFH06DRAFT_684337 [Mycena polygramma]
MASPSSSSPSSSDPPSSPSNLPSSISDNASSSSTTSSITSSAPSSTTISTTTISTSSTTTSSTTTSSQTSTSSPITSSTTPTPTSTPSPTSSSPTSTPSPTDSRSSTSTRSSSDAAPTDPSETLASTVFVTTTDSLGHTTTSVPSAITSIITFTSNGVPITTTEVKVNPTLAPDGHSSGGGSSFFKNAGAVAGVFALVGLAAAAIVLWILFGLRRRRRNRRMKHDSAVSATLAAAGFHRAPLDDDVQQGNGSRGDMEMRAGSSLAMGSGVRTSGYQDSPGHDEDAFNPYNEYVVPAPGEGYIPARTSSPPPATSADRDASESGPGHHSASHSVGSIEPLLAAFRATEPASPGPSGVREDPPTPPPRNPKRVSDRRSQIFAAARPPSPRPQNRRQSTASSIYSSESDPGDDRLNPALRNSDIQDSEDYSRPVLGVRNFPDGMSQLSGES